MQFDRIAPYYDRLSALVYGDSLIRASVQYFHHLQGNERILIAGGGSGVVLDRLDALDLSLHIDYVDMSHVMIERSRKRLPFRNITVDFFCTDMMEFRPRHSYDVIITPFILDFLTQHELEIFVCKFSGYMTRNGRWLFADFVRTRSVPHRILVRMMYAFFRVSAGLKTRGLPDYDKAFQNAGLRLRSAQTSLNGMVESRMYSLRLIPKGSSFPLQGVPQAAPDALPLSPSF